MRSQRSPKRAGNCGRAVVAVAVAATVMVGCGKKQALPAPAPNYSTPAPGSTTTTRPSTSTTPTTVAVTAPTVPGSPAAMVASAVGYLKARENSISANQATPTSWPGPAMPFLTPAFFAKLTAPPPPGVSTGGGDYAYRVAHQGGWQISVAAQCAFDEAKAQPTPTTATLLCTITDTTVDQAGNPVPTSALPGAWAKSGPQQQATLEMANVNGTWLVAADDTGGYAS